MTTLSKRSSIEWERPQTECWKHSPGPNPQIGTSDWRAEMESTRRCSVEGCDQPFSAKGMCRVHYKRMWRGSPMDRPLRQKRERCEIENCERPLRSTYAAMCDVHYHRVRRNGYPGLKPPSDYKEPVRQRVYKKASHVCTVAGCSIVAKSIAGGARVCLMHYKRWTRTGDMSIEAARAAREADRIALVSRMVQLYASGMSTTEVGKAVGRDASRVSRVLRDEGVQMRAPRQKRRDDISYGGAHMRVRKDRGSARNYVCSCGSPAAQWSYTHTDPHELQAREGAYSTDPSYYVAMCVPCHKRADLARISGTA